MQALVRLMSQEQAEALLLSSSAHAGSMPLATDSILFPINIIGYYVDNAALDLEISQISNDSESSDEGDEVYDGMSVSSHIAVREEDEDVTAIEDVGVAQKSQALLAAVEKLAQRLDTQSHWMINYWQKSSMQTKAQNIRNILENLNVDALMQHYGSDEALFAAIKNNNPEFNALWQEITSRRHAWDCVHTTSKTSLLFAEQIKEIDKQFPASNMP